MLRRMFLLILVTFMLTACGSKSPEPAVPDGAGSGAGASNPYAPQPEDGALVRGAVYPSNVDFLVMESAPPQVAMLIKGELPNPCSQLRAVVQPPNADNMIIAEVYSVADPSLACAQVLESFEANIVLGSFPAGHYTVWVNGEQVGEFDA